MDPIKTQYLSLFHVPYEAKKSTTKKTPKHAQEDSNNDNHLLKSFLTLLVKKTLDVMEYRRAMTVVSNDVCYAASTMGIEVIPKQQAITSSADFVRMTTNMFESYKCRADIDDTVYDTLYLIYQGLKTSTVTMTNIPSLADTKESIEDFGTKHYSLSSPTGVHAQFFERELPLDDNDNVNKDMEDDESVTQEDLMQHSDDDDSISIVDLTGDEEAVSTVPHVVVNKGQEIDQDDECYSDEEKEWDQGMENEE